MKNHPLIKALLALRGNPRACVYTEPLWGIPHSLYSPFAAVYMASLMLTDRHIGMVASVSMLFQAISALISGAVTDKLGRKKTTVIFDILAWSVPCLIWAFSQNFWWFVVAAAFNGLWQITANSWTCLLVEDAEKSSVVNIFTFIHLSGQLAVIFAPLSGILVNNLTVVPTMRILYGFTFLSMTAKFIILYFYSVETQIGETRLKETQGLSILKIMSGYGKIFRRVFASPAMIMSLALTTIFTITGMITGNFAGLYITGNLMIPQHFLAYFPIIRSAVIIIFMFGLQSRLDKFGFRYPMLAGILLYITSHIFLILSPQNNLLAPILYIFIEACAYSLVMPRRDSITVLLIEPDERARIYSIITVLTLSVTIPFGYLAGWLSDMDRRYSFLLNIAVFIIAFILIARSSKLLQQSALNKD